MLNQDNYIKKILAFSLAFFLFSCNKLVEIPEPKDTLTTVKVFTTDAQANSAMAGVLTQMINGSVGIGQAASFRGGVTVYNGLSADELTDVINNRSLYSTNSLIAGNDDKMWETAYVTIYGANAIIEGIEASKSPALKEKARLELSAEAKFMRAFSYFYLVNTYGDVALSLTTDFNKTKDLPRTAVATVYQQIINDLLDAVKGLPEDYAAGGGERIRANKWVAKALLARVYLFTGNNAGAVKEATEVMAKTSLYQLETMDLNRVFLKNSSEAIWQLQQNSLSGGESLEALGNATPEGYFVLPTPLHTGGPQVSLSPFLLKAFEPGDLRRSVWVDSTDYTLNNVTSRYLFPYKYKTGKHNRVPGGTATEYYMVLRLAEQYLIRAEANALGGQLGLAINDLNALRRRAGLGDLSNTLNKEQVLAAVAKERQTELFAEWGHRWMDLKRTGKATEVLSAIPYKQPWRGDYQLLYPIPVEEIRKDHFLTQNPNY
jgi:hypothetical protein